MPDLIANLSAFHDQRILVLGDVMLDRFVYGQVRRISPEAPIPVLLKDQEVVMLGGAGNVARNIAALSGRAILVGVVGRDAAAQDLETELLAEQRIAADFVRSDRPTTQKIRYVADQQQLLRVDMETATPVAQDEIFSIFEHYLPTCDIVVLSDYAKGVFTPSLLKAVIAAARAAGKPLVADPKSSDVNRYDGVTVLTPNSAEAAAASGVSCDSGEGAGRAADAILSRAPNIEAVLITRGAKGMTLVERGKNPLHMSALAREVFDVSGAGDTVIAALALAIASGHDLPMSMNLSNIAAGISVSKRGTAVVTNDELAHALRAEHIHATDRKIVPLDVARETVARWRERGESIGFTNGCFDLVHPGHISQLSQARAVCDHLVVGLNSDSSIKRLKGPSRPIQDETARAIVLASLAAVDLVILFDADTPIDLIKAIRPDVLIKGKDYTVDTVVGADIVQSYGGRIFLADLVAGQSTTNIVARLTQ